MSKTHDKPALSAEQQAAIEAIRERARKERPGPDELIDRGELDELVPQAQYIEGRALGVRLRRDPRADGVEPDGRVGTIGTDPRRHQPTGERLEPEPDAGDPVPLYGSPRGGLETRRGRSDRIRKGRLSMASVFKPKGSSKYVILYFDENGDRRKKVGTTDKTVTERIARDIENRVALRERGSLTQRRKPTRKHATRSTINSPPGRKR